MNHRNCPLCSSSSARVSYPYSLSYKGDSYLYLSCSRCRTVFIDPLPSDAAFASMYQKSSYHDVHFSYTSSTPYYESATFFSRFIEPNCKILDFGCGSGHFLHHLKNLGYDPVGIEFDSDAAKSAQLLSECTVYSVDELSALNLHQFDAVHLGDVLEHLPNPSLSLSQLLPLLKPGGCLLVEGPLEHNYSFVFFAAYLYGQLSRLIFPNRQRIGVPTHLFRTSARAQAMFFQDATYSLDCLSWNVWENGWPYSQGRFLKRLISRLSILWCNHFTSGQQFGNRFRAVYKYRP